jgi:integrase
MSSVTKWTVESGRGHPAGTWCVSTNAGPSEGALRQAFDLVLCSEQGRPHSLPNPTYRYFRPVLEKAELPRIRLYGLRHSCATLLLTAEENPKVVSERLGHSTIVLTLDTYSHVLPTMQQQATARPEKMLYSKGRKKNTAA